MNESLAIPHPASRRKPDPIAEQKARYGVDPATGKRIVKLFSGDWHVTQESNDMLVTILGSCVAACIRDPIARIGGMNHFLLPGTENSATNGDATRFGMYAMETLINAILAAGGRKERLEVKVFGGGNVTASTARIGSKNAQFVREFLKAEGINIICEDLEGELPRRIHYTPSTGKVLMRKLNRQEDLAVVDEESRYSRTLTAKPIEGDIDLF